MAVLPQVDGTATERITIKGNGGTSNRENIVLRGEGLSNYVFELKHDYYTLEVRVVFGVCTTYP